MTVLQRIRDSLGFDDVRTRRSERSARPGLEGLERREVMTVAFPSALGGETVFWRSNVNGSSAGSTVSGPVINPTALRNPTVYLIFSGKSWTTTTANWDAYLVQSILRSGYLSGLAQYGASGTATYGGYAIDYRPTPGASGRDAEVQYALDWLEYFKWQKPAQQEPPGLGGRGAGSLSSPIYVVIDDTGDTGASNGGGTYVSWNQPYRTNAINIDNGTNQNTFTEQFTRELVNRIVEGTGNGLAMNAPFNVSGDNYNADIADNEPEGGRYSFMLNGMERVSAYWSVVDQSFIVPDGNQQLVTLVPVWNGQTFTNQFDLYADLNVQGIGLPVAAPMSSAKNYLTLLGSNNNYGGETFIFAGANPIRNVTLSTLVSTWSTSQVYQYHGPGTSWSPITGANEYVDQLVEDENGTFKRENGKAWEWAYGTWTPLTGANTFVSQITALGNQLYMDANVNGTSQVWRWNGYGTSWTPITGTNTYVSQIASAAGEGLFFLGGLANTNQVWKYSGAGSNWSPVTGSVTTAIQLVSTGANVDMLASNGGGYQVWQYAGPGFNWTPITGVNTHVTQIVAAGDGLFMIGSLSGGPTYVWAYEGSGLWAPVTDTTMKVTSIGVKGSTLVAFGPNDDWAYSGYKTGWVVTA